MKAKRFTQRDYVKANRKASREAEIADHSRPISFNHVHRSKKVYDRNRMKADDKRHLPSLFFKAFGYSKPLISSFYFSPSSEETVLVNCGKLRGNWLAYSLKIR